MPHGTPLSKLWQLALGLPGTVEQDHHGRPSFRVGGRIFATVWDPTHLNIMLEEARIRSLVRDTPSACRKVWWAGRLRCVRVDLRSAKPTFVGELLREAWDRRRARTANLRRAVGSPSNGASRGFPGGGGSARSSGTAPFDAARK